MKSIKEIINKIKEKIDALTKDKAVFIIILIIMTAFCSFGLGRLSQTEKNQTPILIQNSILENNNLAQISQSTEEVQPPQVLGGKYVASKNSNKYHAPWCSGAQRIKTDNQIWFNSKEEAELAGYTPASNCKGI